jgi:hypothetical protein
MAVARNRLGRSRRPAQLRCGRVDGERPPRRRTRRHSRSAPTGSSKKKKTIDIATALKAAKMPLEPAAAYAPRAAACERAEQRRDAPEHDGQREQGHPLEAIHVQPDGDREHGADQERDRAQQPDLRVADLERLLELGSSTPTVATSAALSASTAPNSVITRARARPPTRLTTCPRTLRAIHRVAWAAFRPPSASAFQPSRSHHRLPWVSRSSTAPSAWAVEGDRPASPGLEG